MLVVFDGLCGFCNRSVRWMLARDRYDRLRFAPSNSPALESLLTRHAISALAPETILVFTDLGKSNERLLIRSDAVLACLQALPQPWPTLAAFARFIPRPPRDIGYRLIAGLRYRIWGRYTSCPIPTPEQRSHFLSQSSG